MQCTKINNKKISPIKVPVTDSRPVLGWEFIEELYAITFLNAKKKSGKTTALFELLKACAGPETKIMAFVGTLNNDAQWGVIQKYFEEKGISFETSTSTKSGRQDLIKSWIEFQQKQGEEKNEKPGVPDIPMLSFDDTKDIAPVEEKKKKKSKYRAPEYIIVIDDLPGELKSVGVINLLKTNRHFKCKVFLSSQWMHDLLPESRKQIDVLMLWKSFTDKKLLSIMEDTDLNIEFDQFKAMYKAATEPEFGFLYVDVRNERFRKNFDQEFKTPNE